eukprot:CAMPEP_0201515872 /NCGR_PEP_ID=MMETSP0161_2-20130828/7327_1 /ASSEMBLY_ACC=CAM_ASM_000251 /TAXON_ID=180227 /ORGANISM="Neoparamoeba aestuarina, Strain SoJaBio B1-5/56/2" /LENGTH=179 /DNA_ID=CAMNT_0047912811 /DNA_START=54 /DNA_END=590 /DNA_ORIENTATION=+
MGQPHSVEGDRDRREPRTSGGRGEPPTRSQTFEQMQEIASELTTKLAQLSSKDVHFVFETKQKQFNEFKFAPFWRSEVKVMVLRDGKVLRELTFRQFNWLVAEIRALLTTDNEEKSLPLASISEKDEDDDDDECPVCLDAYAGVALGCGHRFCEDCITKWQHNETCPICRAGTKEDDLW